MSKSHHTITRFAVSFAALVMAAIPVAASTGEAAGEVAQPARVQFGKVAIGGTSLPFQVTLYAAGDERGGKAVPLGRADAARDGSFAIAYVPTSNENAVLYLIAEHTLPAARSRTPQQLRNTITLASIVGSKPTTASVMVNENTTVATAYAMAQFAEGNDIAGGVPGVPNAAAISRNLADPATGKVAAFLANPPNGTQTSTFAAFNSLANMLGACSNNPAECDKLFKLATTPRGKAPHSTLQALVNIARNPSHNAKALFDLSQVYTETQPALATAPAAWTLALTYVGNGQEMDGPGNVVFDKDGNAWLTNNYIYNPDRTDPACGSNILMKITPTGQDAPGAPFTGGGLSGDGWGVAIDSQHNVWTANFGFQGKNCATPPPANSLSKFTPTGQPLSPNTGFTQGNINAAQGIAFDQRGNLWIANCTGNSVSVYPGGDPNAAKNLPNLGLSKPFGVVVDWRGYVWVTSNGNHKMAVLDPNGVSVKGSPFNTGAKFPMGNAVDSKGNVWVANTGVIDMPCPSGTISPTLGGAITVLRPNGRLARRPIISGGVSNPWGVAVDGDDNIWVANFSGQRVSHLCGPQPANCPPGKRMGDPISPAAGYASDALVRNTAVGIDPSGNLWVTNNWYLLAVQTNPGGHAMIVFVGIAPPVRAPAIGPARKP